MLLFTLFFYPSNLRGPPIGMWGYKSGIFCIYMGRESGGNYILFAKSPLFSPHPKPLVPDWGSPQDCWGRGKGYKEALLIEIKVIFFRITSNVAIKYNS